MRKQSSLLAIEHAQIVVLHIERLSERQIANRVECSKSSSPLCHIKFKKHEIYDDMKKTGRLQELYEERIMLSNKLIMPPMSCHVIPH